MSRLSKEREAEIRLFTEPDKNTLPQHWRGALRDLFIELDAVRADLAELVGTLPECDARGCHKPATSTYHDEYGCDEHGYGERGFTLEYAPILRRMETR